ncbi:hypothetical protein [Limnoglobus roseus]|uniref:Uncharacterized protein n=1 Tax=Limnoglobus roseus TaxID=2598579 RepID=A0A5C1ARI0_9BACT|nr:hypothetical protein [Limnoglobus roseus]QEL19814.1 hypothetical protein PX52LOC_06894 [Limnoglobus roseus]
MSLTHCCSRSVLTVNGVPLFGTVVRAAEVLRVRLWTEAWETLGVGEGDSVAVAVAVGEEEAEELVVTGMVAVPATGRCWVHFAAAKRWAGALPRVRVLR